MSHRVGSLAIQTADSASGPISEIAGSPALITVILIILLVLLYLAIQDGPRE
jgi:hypothetical protein